MQLVGVTDDCEPETSIQAHPLVFPVILISFNVIPVHGEDG